MARSPRLGSTISAMNARGTLEAQATGSSALYFPYPQQEGRVSHRERTARTCGVPHGTRQTLTHVNIVWNSAVTRSTAQRRVAQRSTRPRVSAPQPRVSLFVRLECRQEGFAVLLLSATVLVLVGRWERRHTRWLLRTVERFLRLFPRRVTTSIPTDSRCATSLRARKNKFQQPDSHGVQT